MTNEKDVKQIDGELFDRMILGGVACLQANSQKVNDLNVFPIPDGDTGENMFLTLKGGFDALKNVTSPRLDQKANAMAQGMLYGARGNSGVILSQLFYGMAQGLNGCESANIVTFGNAMQEGVKRAYGAVIHPVEGTILTVAREATEKTCDKITDDTTVEQFFSTYLHEMKKSLEKTPNLLAVLKEAGVVDSGGAGLVYIIQGFCNVLGGDVNIDNTAFSTTDGGKTVDYSLFTADSEMTFGYCTEVTLRLQNSKVDVANYDERELIDFLQSIGDSVAVVVNDSLVKIHVHTLTPYKVLEYLQTQGEYLAVKVENMTLQHNESEQEKTVKKQRTDYAVVTTACGAGLKQVFCDIGATVVIDGGQTNNPSADDFVKAFDEANADTIFVLPNNGNIILAAQQAAAMYRGSEIIVIESKNIGEGYSALSMLNYGVGDSQAIAASLRDGMVGTVTGMITTAVRDAKLDGVDIVQGGYIGFIDKKMLTCKADKLTAAMDLLDKLGVSEKEYLIVFYGKNASESDRQQFSELFMQKYDEVELYDSPGEQDVYDFIFIIE